MSHIELTDQEQADFILCLRYKNPTLQYKIFKGVIHYKVAGGWLVVDKPDANLAAVVAEKIAKEPDLDSTDLHFMKNINIFSPQNVIICSLASTIRECGLVEGDD